MIEIIVVFSLGIIIGVLIGGIIYCAYKYFEKNEKQDEYFHRLIENEKILEKYNKMLLGNEELKLSKKKMMEILEARNNYNSV